jgi:hypothetical protein
MPRPATPFAGAPPLPYTAELPDSFRQVRDSVPPALALRQPPKVLRVRPLRGRTPKNYLIACGARKAGLASNIIRFIRSCRIACAQPGNFAAHPLRGR